METPSLIPQAAPVAMPLARHPLAVDPELSGDEFALLVADVRLWDGVLDPVTLLDGMVLDGWNRYRACLEAGVPCTFVEYDRDRAMVGDWLRSKNSVRRHLTPGYRIMRRDALVAEARRLRGRGLSIPAVARALGVSVGTAFNLLKPAGAAVDPNAPPPEADEPDTADGEQPPEPSTMPQDESEPAEAPGGDPDEPDVVRDAAGRRVPACQRAAFENEALDRAARLLEQAAALLDVPREWEKASARVDVLGIPRALRVGVEKLRGARPHTFCWDCRGKGCGECDNAGYYTFKEQG